MTLIIKRFFFFISLIAFSLNLNATHNRAGEITYKHIGGLEYEITITTYTKASSTQADRCSLNLRLGDGTEKEVVRSNGNYDQSRGCNIGVNLGNDIKMNEYRTTHTYESAGTYTLTMEDPNRNGGVQNIPNSIDVRFALRSTIFIYNATIPNSSPKLTIPPVDRGCLRRIYEHNPGAVDQDLELYGRSDSLSYSLAVSLADSALPISNFDWPDQIAPGPNNNLTIDELIGTLTWDAPQRTGEYNVAIEIEEYREINGRMRIVGRVLRDIQIDIEDCVHESPVISEIDDTCVTAGSVLNKTVEAETPNNTFLVDLEAYGDPFGVSGNRATFGTNTQPQSVTGEFNWETQCRHIRNQPYNVIFRAEDDNPSDNFHSPLSTYSNWKIDVLAPPPHDVSAEPSGSGLDLQWAYTDCNNNSGYKIYRYTDSTGYEAPVCETGVPASTGYELVETINSPSTFTYYDDDNGDGLKNGIRYCYMITAIYDGGSESYPSVEFCGQLKRDVPIITRVSVNETDDFNGSDTVMWSPPIELDTNAYSGPYSYKVYRSTNISNDFTEIHETPQATYLKNADTIYLDEEINTRDNQHTYRIALLSNGQPVNTSATASSPFLGGRGMDNRAVLRLNERVPWINEEYVIFRQDLDTEEFVVIDTTFDTTYVDSNLANLRERCYKVLTVGYYSIDSILTPLLNYSQEFCVTPEDNEPPCPPQVEIDSDCELGYNELTWRNPNTLCDTVDDVVSYNIYYKKFRDEGQFRVIENTYAPEDTTFLFEDMESVAGCYVITAVDSFDNESAFSGSVCVDNCPEYRLPNVITPGGDGYNDHFRPFPYRQVEKIELKVFNRWGALVYETEDPDIMWDGTHISSGEKVSAGVYFYTCVVHEIRLDGIQTRTLKGNLTIFYEEEPTYRID